MIQPVREWVQKRIGREIIELPNLTIDQQLQNYDAAKSGVGFVLVLAMITTDVESEYPEATHASVISLPIIKILGEWVTLTDENLADILASVIRIIAPKNEVSSDDNIRREQS